jgi:hypothetical protein
MIERKIVEKVISKGFADKLDETIIDVSRDISFTRREMVEDLGCANFLAAYRLQRVLKRLKITTFRQLFDTDPFSLARAKGIGEAAIFVAMCMLDNAQYSVEEWWQWDGNNVKFSAFKAQAIRKANKRGHEV